MLNRFVSIAIISIALCAGFMQASAQNSSKNDPKSTTASNAPVQTRYMRFGIGLSDDHPQGMAVKKFAADLLASLPAHDLIGLAWWENGFRNLTNSRGPITRKQDLMDLKVRVMPNAMFSDTFQSLGAEPLKLPFPEVYANLKEGKVQAQENPLITIYASKFYEVQQHLTLSRHAYSAWVVMIDKPVWDSLNTGDRASMQTAALESSKYQRELIRTRNAQMVDELRKLGMKVTEIDRTEQPIIRMARRKVIDKYAQEFGADWTKKLYLQLAMNEHSKLQKNASR